MAQTTRLNTADIKQQLNNKPRAERNPQRRYDETQNLTFSEFRRFALAVHGSYSKFGRAIGTDRANAKRILDGLYIPKKVSTIEKIAKSFNVGISPVVITRMFEEMKK